ncbi:MAG TPA: histidine phosphatase family protein [Permianibacter sp.]|nr:histidine phosphatase family protein [Permianibacter sp.]
MSLLANPLLILLRHGQAEPYRLDDASRALVAQGEAQVARSAAFLAAQGYVPTALLASPYRRAQQSAECIQQQLALSQPISRESLLVPDADVVQTGALLAATLESLMAGPQRPVLLAASHMPLVASLRGYFVGAERGFQTGALCVIERHQAGAGLIDWRLLAEFDPG